MLSLYVLFLIYPYIAIITSTSNAVSVVIWSIVLYVICHFSRTVFNILFLSLILSSVIMMCLGMVFFECTLFWLCWASQIYKLMSFIKFGEFVVIFSALVIFSSPSGTPVAQKLDLLILFHMPLFGSSSVFLFFRLYHYHWSISMFTDSHLCHLYSSIELIYLIFLLQILCFLVLKCLFVLLKFYFLLRTFIFLFILCVYLYLMQHSYYNCFKLFVNSNSSDLPS